MSRKTILSDQDEQEIAKSYEDGALLDELAGQFHCSYRVLAKIIRSKGVAIRPASTPPYTPTLEEIKVRAAEIRKGWTPAVYCDRDNTKKRRPYEFPRCPTVHLHDNSNVLGN